MTETRTHNGKTFILFTHWLPKDDYWIIENLEKSYEKNKLEERYCIFEIGRDKYSTHRFAFGIDERYFEFGFGKGKK